MIGQTPYIIARDLAEVDESTHPDTRQSPVFDTTLTSSQFSIASASTDETAAVFNAMTGRSSSARPARQVKVASIPCPSPAHNAQRLSV